MRTLRIVSAGFAALTMGAAVASGTAVAAPLSLEPAAPATQIQESGSGSSGTGSAELLLNGDLLDILRGCIGRPDC
ncbi:hypothetical protein [Nocardia sp. CNY236]|uniref:hypothetical protein n=1 Tax=Nocardia sp. CNY236 TaxID=1169152 RepID=UPI0018CBE619|nr:hypothetical protein [Nocardia sp. CNY236]